MLVFVVCFLSILDIFIASGFIPNVPKLVSFLSTKFPKFLNLKGIISNTDLGKYFKLCERKAHSSSRNSKSLWNKYLYFFRFNFLSLKT